MKKLIAKAKVLLKAAPTYLATAGAVIAIAVDEVSSKLPAGWQDNAFQIGGILATVIAVATAIVRRVSPVFDKNQRYLTPPT